MKQQMPGAGKVFLTNGDTLTDAWNDVFFTSIRRLVKLENDQVTFRYRATDTGEPKLVTLSAEAFIHRFLQHVLPKGFVKVRYFGFIAPGCRKRLAAFA